MEPTPMSTALQAERVAAERVLAKGTVKAFDAVRGVGLVRPDEGDDDLPMATPGAELVAGDRVVFEVDEGAHGLEAFGVTRLAAPSFPRPH